MKADEKGKLEIAIDSYQKGYKHALMEAIIAVDSLAIYREDITDVDKIYNMGVVRSVKVLQYQLEKLG